MKALRIPAVVLLAACTAALVVIAPASSDQSPTCSALFDGRTGADLAEEVRTSREVTRYYDDGTYEVTRCSADGKVTIDQLVGPIPVPGEKERMVPYRTTVPARGGYRDTIPTYGSPEDPEWSAVWEKHGDEVMADVIQPTEVAP